MTINVLAWEKFFIDILTFFLISGQDRNFALERYGTNSRCFDHTEQMWEERSCEQVS